MAGRQLINQANRIIDWIEAAANIKKFFFLDTKIFRMYIYKIFIAKKKKKLFNINYL